VTGFTFNDTRDYPNIWADRLHDDDRERVLAALAARKLSGSFSSSIAGNVPAASTSISSIRRCCCGTARQPVEYAGTLMDVTGPQAARDAARSCPQDGRDRPADGGIAHDFNNLLAAVLGGSA
jgi:hypothetical protein